MITLRRRGQIEATLSPFLEQPLPESARHASLALHLGAAQILFLRIPPHAAVSTSVDVVAKGPGRQWKGLVNGVLRNLVRYEGDPLAGQNLGRLNTPAWLWTSWTRAYEEETADAIAQAHLEEPPLDVAVREKPEEWAKKLEGTLTSLGVLRLRPTGPIEALPGYNEGAWWIQDAAAQLPVRMLGNLKGKRIADLCAAPGGKTLQLAAAEANVTAVEISSHRARRLEANLRRTKLNADVVVADASSWETQEPFDAILVDAPCSATGTIRRRPDVAWRHTPSDLNHLAKLQDLLLDAAMRLVREGGQVVYAVCSLEPEEGPQRIRALVKRNPDAEIVPLAAQALSIPDELVTHEGFLRTLPCHLAEEGGMDGFFAALIRRPAKES